MFNVHNTTIEIQIKITFISYSVCLGLLYKYALADYICWHCLVVLPLCFQVTVVCQVYEEKIKGLMPAEVRQELEDTITSLKAQVIVC